MNDAAQIVRLVRCPRCRSPWCQIYKTRDTVQYRTCLSCEFAFKTIRELPDRPRPDNGPPAAPPEGPTR